MWEIFEAASRCARLPVCVSLCVCACASMCCICYGAAFVSLSCGMPRPPCLPVPNMQHTAAKPISIFIFVSARASMCRNFLLNLGLCNFYMPMPCPLIRAPPPPPCHCFRLLLLWLSQCQQLFKILSSCCAATLLLLSLPLALVLAFSAHWSHSKWSGIRQTLRTVEQVSFAVE